MEDSLGKKIWSLPNAPIGLNGFINFVSNFTIQELANLAKSDQLDYRDYLIDIFLNSQDCRPYIDYIRRYSFQQNIPIYLKPPFLLLIIRPDDPSLNKISWYIQGIQEGDQIHYVPIPKNPE